MPEAVHEIKVSTPTCASEDSRLIRLTMPLGTSLLKIEPWSSFLSHGRSSRVFQDMNVFDILDVVFGTYARRGSMAPAWRFDVAEPASYPKRRLTSQYQESDLSFVERLMREEGLIYFFEHSGDVPTQSLGTHTMVIAGHGGAFQPATQGSMAFSRQGVS